MESSPLNVLATEVGFKVLTFPTGGVHELLELRSVLTAGLLLLLRDQLTGGALLVDEERNSSQLSVALGGCGCRCDLKLFLKIVTVAIGFLKGSV